VLTPTDLSGRHVACFSWRDTRNPEGGGAELYLEKVAQGLVARGATVTIFCAAHDQAPPVETVDGIRYVRRGSKLSVYVRGLMALATRSLGRIDAVVDVQNGLPFFTRLLTRRPVIVLVHHVHREQWPVVYPGLVGRVGWWIESRLSPRLYRRSQYVAVSRATRRELVDLGVDRERIAVVHNGTDRSEHAGCVPKAATPTVCTVGRLVPHKQVEHAIDACVELRRELPGLRLVVVGSGWWEENLREVVHTAGAGDVVTFEGHVSETRKHEVYAESWVMALPSLKEGWGLVVGEAGLHGTPTVAYRTAGGTRESIEDGCSGLLADDQDEFVTLLRSVLHEPERRARLSSGAREMSHRFTWEHAQGSFALVVESALAGKVLSTQDPDEG
jgi:glycosyltransferase involved in cell wall biosynthesis